MKNKFSKQWKASKKPSKQRKYLANAPKHMRNKLIASHLSPTLKKKYSTRSFTLKKGDKVKILRGQFKGKSGKVERIDTTKLRTYITGIEFIKKEGSKALYPIHPSNLIIEELNTEDRRRMKRTGGKSS